MLAVEIVTRYLLLDSLNKNSSALKPGGIFSIFAPIS